jgi:hypothetical protein
MSKDCFNSCGCLSFAAFEAASSLSTIGEFALAYYSSLRSIGIPALITAVSQWGFADCERRFPHFASE